MTTDGLTEEDLDLIAKRRVHDRLEKSKLPAWIPFKTGAINRYYEEEKELLRAEIRLAAAKSGLTEEAKTADVKSKTTRPRMAVSILDAAEICKCSTRTIKNWEAGKHTPRNPDYPGRSNPVSLRAFAATKESNQNTKRALKNMMRCDVERLPKR